MFTIFAAQAICVLLVHSTLALSTNRTFISATARGSTRKIYRAQWTGKGQWVGRAWWANPLWDWKRDGTGDVRAAAARDRALTLLPLTIHGAGASFTLQATITFFPTTQPLSPRVAAGFALSRRGPFNDYRSAAVYPKSQLFALVRPNGALSLLNAKSKKGGFSIGKPILLTLQGNQKNGIVSLTLTAKQFSAKTFVKVVVKQPDVLGVLALITEGPPKRATEIPSAVVSFRNFSVYGSMILEKPDRSFGPIMWTQYTVSDETLRIQAQLSHIDKPETVSLSLTSRSGQMKPIFLKTTSDYLSRTARFTVPNWKAKYDWTFVVQITLFGRSYKWNGQIRKEPNKIKPFRIAAFSCDQGYLFPLSQMVSQVYSQNPDLVYFAGDQIYGQTGGFSYEEFAPIDIAMVDFLRRWYLFGWTWRYILRDRPSVIIPDDHDVYQGNLWGNGGTRLKNVREKKWSKGGYFMPAAWINAVERCNAGHLPPPAANFKTPYGLKPYFTSMRYGGVSMAILEDRKFKTGPFTLPLSDRTEGKGGQLLGMSQEKFLRKWTKMWKNASMKIAFSQTIFTNAATHTGQYLDRTKSNFDTGAWPYAARDRTVQLLGQNNVLSLHGDQHFGILLRHGVKTFDDGGLAFMVPGTANGFPRAWRPERPGGPKGGPNQYTGKFVNDASQKMTVFAVGNPEPGGVWLNEKKTEKMTLGRARGSGYGVVDLNLQKQTGTFHLYRVGKNNDEFSGFPKTVFVGGQPGTNG